MDSLGNGMNDCIRCANENHAACDGGAWDNALKPAVCECFMRYHHRRTYADEQADRLADRYEASLERGASNA